MKKTVKTIALSVAFLTGAGMANAQDTEVAVDTGLETALATLSQQVTNGSALNLAVNTADINASVNTEGGFDAVNNFENTIETSALGAVNTGNLAVEQGSLSALSTGTLNATLEDQQSQLESLTDTESDSSSQIESALGQSLDASFNEELNQTLSNYSVANVAFNSGAIDASVNTITGGTENNINGIKTSAIGAVNTGSITVTVK
ncbi:hypothetical protein E0H88_02665 [Acinetobacter sp. ANC 4216]|uniref:hypothetical protein n=1 Tax=Acinetobacter sp. ANC 4216 TaxID=2529840 RepID=UPI00103A4D8D|nr:hypothetical protein [Acinetobacter sp. ANC 4216]TCB71919.1 hypothetical protein E0H88_02665 [Acinetobacter sp. ANC 4216]